MALELHPLCTLFPRLSGAEFDALVADIRANGLREPIITHDGMILDGGNRYRACLDAGVTPHTMKFGGGNLVTYVLSANLHRRHLSAGQQAAIVASAQDWGNAQTVGNPAFKDQKCNVAPLQTVADRATESGASVRTQKMADKVAKADPELAKQVGHGEISLPKAVEKITGKKRQSAKPAIAEAVNPEPDYTELDAANDKISELQDMLAVRAEPEEERAAAGDLLTSLRSEIKRLEVSLAAVTSSRDSLMRENAQLMTQLRSQRNQLKKSGIRAAA